MKFSVYLFACIAGLASNTIARAEALSPVAERAQRFGWATATTPSAADLVGMRAGRCYFVKRPDRVYATFFVGTADGSNIFTVALSRYHVYPDWIAAVSSDSMDHPTAGDLERYSEQAEAELPHYTPARQWSDGSVGSVGGGLEYHIKKVGSGLLGRLVAVRSWDLGLGDPVPPGRTVGYCDWFGREE